MTTTASFETTEFRRTFKSETIELLRKRMIWFISLWGGFNLIMLAIMIVAMSTETNISKAFSDNWMKAFFIFTSVVWLGAYAVVLALVIGRSLNSKHMVYLSLGLVILDGAVSIGSRVVEPPGSVGAELLTFIFSFSIACCIFPWTVKQSIVPIVAIACASFLTHITIEQDPILKSTVFTVLLVIACSPAVFVIGVKYSQRIQKATNKFLNQRYGMLRQELAYARQVHESLFPAPQLSGNIRFSYQYEPMRQIGGDYLYTKTHYDENGQDEKLSVVIVDVTGHGIPAALTVNRLHGEIDISFAEDPDISPGDMLAKLNRYVHLTLAKHSIYATAICLRVDHKRGIVEYASGGHPPSFIRGVDGTLRDLDPTTFVLGACAEADFDSSQFEVEMMPGDSLIAYTDGAIEARATDGKMLHINGLRAILASNDETDSKTHQQGIWAERILDLVTQYRGGLPPDDDTLAIEIYRPLGIDQTPDIESQTQIDPDTQSVIADEFQTQ